MVKKAAKKKITKKATKEASSKKVAKKAAAKKSTKKATKKSKHTVTPPTHEEIAIKAYDLYTERVVSGTDGCCESDWFAALDYLNNKAN